MLDNLRERFFFGGSLVLVLLFLIGCHSGSDSPSGISQPDISQPGISQSIPSKFHITGKPGANVSIKNEQPIVLHSLGQQSIELLLHSADYPGVMSVSLSASSGVTLMDTTQPVVFSLEEKGEYRLPISLNIEQEGRHYVRLHIAVTTNGITEKRVIAAIIQVGETHTKLQKVAPAAASEDVISLPAQERVSPLR